MAWLGNWKKRIKLTIDSGDVDVALSDFPTLVYLSTSSGITSADVSAVFDELLLDANRKKIAITTSDGQTQCYVEIDKWDDANEKAWLWVKVPSVASGTDTDIYLYYDIDKADNDTYVGDTNSTPAESVWNANFKAVYHMADGVDNAHIYDSTNNNNDGTKKAANEPNEVDGQVAKAQDFAGTDDYITIPDHPNLDLLTGFTISKWLKLPTSAIAGITGIIGKSDGTSGGGGWLIAQCGGALGLNKIYVALFDGAVPSPAFITTDAIPLDTWFKLTVIWDGTTIAGSIKVYFNTVQKAGAETNYGTTPALNDLDVTMGKWTGAAASAHLKGIVDELRFSDINRTPAWIKATYESSWDDLLAFGSEELRPQYLIDGIEVQIEKGSLIVENRIEERSIANFTVVDLDGTLSYQKGQSVVIEDPNGILIFGGVIDNPETIRAAPSGGLLHPITCIDYHYFADKRLVAASYVGQTCKFIVEDIFDNYLAEEGITLGNVDVGATLVQAVFNYVRVTDAYDALAEKAGFIWFIDEYKKLYFQARDTTPADWTLTGDDITKRSGVLSGANPMYRNRQYIRGGKGTTIPQSETFSGDAQTVAFTVGYPIVEVPTVTVGVGVQDVGIKGIDVAEDCYWSKGDATIVFDQLSIPPAVADNILIEYVGEYKLLGLATDAPAIAALRAIEGAGTGYVDDIADEPKLTDSDAVLDSGQAKLAKFAVNAQRFNFSTVRTGLKPSQLLTVAYPTLGLADDMLIESVITRVHTGNLFYDVVAIVGAEQRGWTEYFKSLSQMKQEVIDFLNVGLEEILIILAEDDGVVEVDSDISGTFVTQCPFPAATLYPEATLYPC